VQTALAFVHHKLIGASCQNTDGPSSVLDASDADNLDTRFRVPRFLDEVCITKFVLSERVNVGDGLASQTLGQELNLVALHVPDDEDTKLLQKVEGEFIDGVAEDGLLNKEGVAVGLFDLFTDVEDVLTTFLQDLVHLAVVVDHDSVVHLSCVSMGSDVV